MAPQTTDKTKRTVTLGDLTEADRKALLEQAREQAKHNPTDVEGYESLSARNKAMRALMDARDHVRGCPVQLGRELGRIEAHDGRRPPNPATGEPERFLGVIRCVECGGSTVLEARLEAAVEATIAELELEDPPTDA
jgi:hypothetical protein